MKVEGTMTQVMPEAAKNNRNKAVSGKEFAEQIKADKTAEKDKPDNFGQFVSSMAKSKDSDATRELMAMNGVENYDAENFGAAISAIARAGYESQLSEEQAIEESEPEVTSTVPESEPDVEAASNEDQPVEIIADLIQDPLEIIEETSAETDSANQPSAT